MPMIDLVILDGGNTVIRYFPQYSGPMAHWPHLEAIPDIRAALEGLRRDYRLVMATNAADSDTVLVRQALERVGLNTYFEAVVTARDLGVLKPDPAFFEALLATCAVVPHRAVMIGDTFRTDIVGAKHAGLRAVWYNPSGAPAPSDVPIRPDAVIRSMAELPAVIHEIDDKAGNSI